MEFPLVKTCHCLIVLFFLSFAFFCFILLIEAEIRKNTDLATLADEFRLCANKLVDMLDGRMPVVSRLKVRMFSKAVVIV